MADQLWGVRGVNGEVLAVHSEIHAEAMVEALASMGIAVETLAWPGTADEHARCMAESAEWAGPIQ